MQLKILQKKLNIFNAWKLKQLIEDKKWNEKQIYK
jgi:hypothetical protein